MAIVPLNFCNKLGKAVLLDSYGISHPKYTTFKQMLEILKVKLKISYKVLLLSHASENSI